MYQKRWLTRRDFFWVLNSLERFTSAKWTHDDYVAALRQPKKVGIVIHPPDDAAGVVAVVVYQLHKHKLVIEHILANPEMDFAMPYLVQILDEKISKQGRTSYEIIVPVGDYFTIHSLTACGLDHVDGDDDYIVFERSVQAKIT